MSHRPADAAARRRLAIRHTRSASRRNRAREHWPSEFIGAPPHAATWLGVPRRNQALVKSFVALATIRRRRTRSGIGRLRQVAGAHPTDGFHARRQGAGCRLRGAAAACAIARVGAEVVPGDGAELRRVRAAAAGRIDGDDGALGRGSAMDVVVRNHGAIRGARARRADERDEQEEARWKREGRHGNEHYHACASRDYFALMGSRRRPRRFVPWLVVSLADRDLLFQDSHVFSSGGFAPARSSR